MDDFSRRTMKITITPEQRLNVIERDLQIGNSLMAGINLADWRGKIEAQGNEAALNRLAAALTVYQELLDYEAIHGRFSRLDRDSPEILSVERRLKEEGRQSIYQGTQPEAIIVLIAESAASEFI